MTMITKSHNNYCSVRVTKFQNNELGKFIPNFPLKHVITSTNCLYINRVTIYRK